ncbi:MAG TPA: hypothetical protein PLR69_12795, partial [Candidatus Limiplasma sp.]|nr:hypothetical protein [Candidatus Limiplasma sp.]
MACYQEKNKLYRRMGTELLCIEPWGANALRVRATRNAACTGENWALTEAVSADLVPQMEVSDDGSSIRNG